MGNHLSEDEVRIVVFFRKIFVPRMGVTKSVGSTHENIGEYNIIQLNEMDAHAGLCEICAQRVSEIEKATVFFQTPIVKRIRIHEDGTRTVEDVEGDDLN